VVDSSFFIVLSKLKNKTQKNYLVKISLPSLVACRVYSMPLWAISTVLRPRSSTELDTGAAAGTGEAAPVCGGLARAVSAGLAVPVGVPDSDGVDGNGLELI
jgi:hypothetical protein